LGKWGRGGTMGAEGRVEIDGEVARERDRGEVDEIEMELPEGTDGPAGFRTRRKIKTRPNGCEGKFYPTAVLQPLPWSLSNYAATEL